MEQHQELEERIEEIGAVIYSSAAGSVPSVFDKKRFRKISCQRVFNKSGQFHNSTFTGTVFTDNNSDRL